MEHGDDGDNNCNWCPRNNSQKLGKKKNGGTGNQSKNLYHPDYSIVEIDQNTEKTYTNSDSGERHTSWYEKRAKSKIILTQVVKSEW